jgi:SPP1 gp7 family putative phage head morphogenesis protein
MASASTARRKFAANLVRLHRDIGAARRPRRLPRPGSLRALEREYARQLLSVVTQVRDALKPLMAILPRLSESARRDLQRLDARRLDAGEGKRARELIEAAKKSLGTSLNTTKLEKIAEQFASKTQTFERVQLGKQVKSALGIDLFGSDAKLKTLVDGFVAENVALIKDIPAKMLSDVETTVTRGIASGKLTKDLAQDIDDRLGVGESRAKLIARDQIGKFYSKVTSARHQAMGVNKFVWRTMNDERVRDSHEVLEGEVFAYDNLPEPGLPGEEINCRCYQEPYFGDILEEVEQETEEEQDE